MAGQTEFGDDPLAPGCYSQLLFGDEICGLETEGCFGFTSSFSSDDNNQNSILNSPKMLCFGDYAKQCGSNAKKTPPFTCMDPSPKTNNTKKRNGSGTHTAAGNQRTSKKAKSENSGGGGGGGGGGRHAKGVKKEKLGERITALQQLVSPFGKTDTASVLHEALGYIRFLHDQVQVLCSPYLQRSSSHPSLTVGDDVVDSKKSETSKDDLRSRGLCLVPVDLTLHVADSNGADLWSSTPIINSVPSS